MQFGEIALDFQQQSSQRVGFALHLLEVFIVQFQRAGKVGEQRLSLEDKRVLIQTCKGAFVIVILVVNLADDFLDDVLHGDNAAGAAELIDHNGYVHLVPLEVAQEIVNHLGLRHEIRGADQTLPAEVGGFAQMGQKVFDVQHSLDIVLRALIDGDAAIIILDDTLQHLGKGSPYVQVNNVHSAGHHLACHLAAEAYDTLQHAAFLGNVLLVGEFHSLLQIVHREALRLRMDKSLGDDLAAYQDVAERRAELHEHGECRSCKAAEGERTLVAVYLGHHFAKEQKQEGEDYRKAEELEPAGISELNCLHEKVIQQHDDGHIHQIVADENGGQQALAVFAESQDACVGRTLALLDFAQVGRTETKESYLTARDKTGTSKEQQGKQQGKDATGVGSLHDDMGKDVAQIREESREVQSETVSEN